MSSGVNARATGAVTSGVASAAIASVIAVIKPFATDIIIVRYQIDKPVLT